MTFRSVGGSVLEQGASFSTIGTSGFSEATRGGMGIADTNQKNQILVSHPAAAVVRRPPPSTTLPLDNMMTSSRKGTHKKGQGFQLNRPDRVQKSCTAIVSVLEGVTGGGRGGCNMLNLRGH
eukprot:12889767-Prorocentrum_lima.AAC.1